MPQTSHQPPSSATDTGVSHDPTAATSLSVRKAQPVSVCQAGFGSDALHPPPLPRPRSGSSQTCSDQPRAFDAFLKLVPPTPTTLGEDAGNHGEPVPTNSPSKPLSPAAAVIMMPG